jgi:hypothetical protein
MSFLPYLDKAILALAPGAQWTLSGDTYEGLEWLDTNIPKPTKEAVLAEIANQAVIAAGKSHHIQRSYAYPRIADQLDMIWHAIDQGGLNKTSDFYTTIAAVKAQIPAPSQADAQSKAAEVLAQHGITLPPNSN